MIYAVRYNNNVLVIHYDDNIHYYYNRENLRIITDDDHGDLHTILVDKAFLINIKKIETIIIDPLLVNHKFTSCVSLFSGFTNLKRIIGLEYLNTSEVVSMKYMFSDCTSLTSLNLRGLDTSKVTEMRVMFGGCKNLTGLDLSNFDTSNVSDMYAMFTECEGLTNLDLRNFNTSKVTDFGHMFCGCINLTELNVSNFNILSANMSWMFVRCQKIKNNSHREWLEHSKRLSDSLFVDCPNLVGDNVRVQK